jgi:hypothetical protein
MSAESDVISGYLKAGAWVVADFGAAWVVARISHRFAPVLVGTTARAAAFLAGSGMLLVATIGGLGWAIQSFDGNTPPELLNQCIFRFLSIGGAFLLVYDFHAARQARAASP